MWKCGRGDLKGKRQVSAGGGDDVWVVRELGCRPGQSASPWEASKSTILASSDRALSSWLWSCAGGIGEDLRAWDWDWDWDWGGERDVVVNHDGVRLVCCKMTIYSLYIFDR